MKLYKAMDGRNVVGCSMRRLRSLGPFALIQQRFKFVVIVFNLLTALHLQPEGAYFIDVQV